MCCRKNVLNTQTFYDVTENVFMNTDDRFCIYLMQRVLPSGIASIGYVSQYNKIVIILFSWSLI